MKRSLIEILHWRKVGSNPSSRASIFSTRVRGVWWNPGSEAGVGEFPKAALKGFVEGEESSIRREGRRLKLTRGLSIAR